MYIAVKVVTVDVFNLLFCNYFIMWAFVFNIWQVWYDTIKCLRCLEPKMDPSEWIKNAEVSLSWKANSFHYTKWAILFWNLWFVESMCIYSHSMAARDFVFPGLDLHCRVRGLAGTSVCEVQSIFLQGTEPASCYTYVVIKWKILFLKPWYYDLI